ncbi:unnamed protein product [Closterium sp. NIES-54]
MEWYGMTWNGMVWHDMEWHGMEWNGMAWNGGAAGRSCWEDLHGAATFKLQPTKIPPRKGAAWVPRPGGG